jgi:hypothetical protein
MTKGEGRAYLSSRYRGWTERPQAHHTTPVGMTISLGNTSSIPHGIVIPTGANPDFLLQALANGRVCGFPLKKAA